MLMLRLLGIAESNSDWSHCHVQLPEAATSAMSFLVTCAMKPTMEKITKPANMLVHELMQHTMTESLGRGNNINIYFKKCGCCERFKLTFSLHSMLTFLKKKKKEKKSAGKPERRAVGVLSLQDLTWKCKPCGWNTHVLFEWNGKLPYIE